MGIQQNAMTEALLKTNSLNPSLTPRVGGTGVVIPYASDSDSGSVDLQLSNLEDIQKDVTNVEFTGEKGKGVFFFF